MKMPRRRTPTVSEAPVVESESESEVETPSTVQEVRPTEEVSSCPICITLITECIDPHLLIPCGHSLCLECIEKMNDRTCPICKTQITSTIANMSIGKHVRHDKTKQVMTLADLQARFNHLYQNREQYIMKSVQEFVEGVARELMKTYFEEGSDGREWVFPDHTISLRHENSGSLANFFGPWSQMTQDAIFQMRVNEILTKQYRMYATFPTMEDEDGDYKLEKIRLCPYYQ